MKWIYISFILLNITVFNRCNNTDNNSEWRKQAEYEINKHIGIEMQYSTVFFSPYSQGSIDSVMNAECKIVTSIDAGCTTCLNKFSYWINFMKLIDSLSSKTIPIMLYVYSDFNDRKQLEKFMNERWPFLWIYDYNYEFIDKNDLHDDRFQALVLDKNNTVRLMGNPYLNKNMEKLYIKYITSKDENTH